MYRHSAPSRSQEPVEQIVPVPEDGAGSGYRKVTVAGHHGQIAGCLSAKWSKGTGGPSGNETQNIVAFSCTDYGADTCEVSPTIRAMRHDGSHPNAGGNVAIAIEERLHQGCSTGGGSGVSEDLAFTLRSRPVPQAIAIQERMVSENLDAGPQGAGIADDVAYTIEARRTPQAVAFAGRLANYVVRKITPREGERLQGFPDDHTLIEWPTARRKGDDIEDNREYLRSSGYSEEDVDRLTDTPDGPRYCAIGNAMPVPVMRWILRRCIERMEPDAYEKTTATADLR